MSGLGSKMPLTALTSVVGSLSTAGIPPLSGFWSKLIIIIALWQAQHTAYAAIAVGASILTLAYLLVMQRKVFFGKLGPDLEDTVEARPGITAAAVLLAVILVASGVFFPAAYSIFIVPIQEMFIK